MGKNKSVDASNKMAVSLGPVGGRIVAETLIGLLLGDSHSFVNQDPNFKPRIPSAKSDAFTMGDFIKYALRV